MVSQLLDEACIDFAMTDSLSLDYQVKQSIQHPWTSRDDGNVEQKLRSVVRLTTYRSGSILRLITLDILVFLVTIRKVSRPTP